MWRIIAISTKDMTSYTSHGANYMWTWLSGVSRCLQRNIYWCFFARRRSRGIAARGMNCTRQSRTRRWDWCFVSFDFGKTARILSRKRKSLCQTMKRWHHKAFEGVHQWRTYKRKKEISFSEHSPFWKNNKNQEILLDFGTWRKTLLILSQLRFSGRATHGKHRILELVFVFARHLENILISVRRKERTRLKIIKKYPVNQGYHIPWKVISKFT